MLGEEFGHLGLDRLGQQGARSVAQHRGKRVGERPWLKQLDDVSIGHGVSLLCWRSGGSNTPTIRRLLPVRPSPTSAHSSSFHWVCYACTPGNNYRFSVLVGTVFENSKVDLRQWFRVIHLMLTSKKGISALQVHRYMGFGSYATAWYMCRRIRAGLANEGFRKLMGIVEVDETFLGRKAENRH